MKSYTDLGQSHKLAEILPLESADMSWQQIYDENHMMSDYRVELIPYRLYSGIGIPCWSLAALLGVLPYPSIHKHADETWWCDVWVDKVNPYSLRHFNTPIDACYEMILKLNGLKML